MDCIGGARLTSGGDHGPAGERIAEYRQLG
jgi:hypothetical protein